MEKSGASNISCCKEACTVVSVHASIGVSVYVRRHAYTGECADEVG